MNSKRPSMIRAILSMTLIISLIPLATLTSSAADGDLDLAFDTDGRVTTDFGGARDVASGIAIQADGKIIVAGEQASVSSPSGAFGLARYNTDGSLDTSFDGDGKVATLIGGRSAARAVAVQADGKIIAAGSAFSVGGTIEDFALARYNANGSLDNTFNGSGTVITPIGNGQLADLGNGVAIQADGKIVVAGTTFTSDTGGTQLFALARYNSNGSLDTNFDGDGKLTTTFAVAASAEAVLIQSDGKIVAAGVQNLARYLSDGTLDNSFGTGGRVFINNITLHAAALQTDGNIVVAGLGDSGGGQLDFALARINPGGFFETTFGTNGRVFTDFNGFGDEAFALAIQNDGKIVAAGRTNVPNRFALARYNPSGSLDVNFGTGGKVITAFVNADDQANGVAIQSDGKIVAAGRTGINATSDFAVARYLSSGGVINRPPLFDYDGDGLTDVSVFRPSDGTWYMQRSAAGFTAIRFGISTDRIVPADYDGDDKTDVAVFRNGNWFLQQSTAGFADIEFGQSGDIPAPGDFDGDLKADVAVFRPSDGTWYLQRSTAGFTAIQFGTNGDVPVICDFDGDGKSEITVFRPSSGTWFSLLSSNGSISATQFGTTGDLPVAGDYDGDAQTDVAVYRPSEGTWYLLRSLMGFAAVQFGNATDRPAPGDYDGDGKADIAVFRNGVWYQLRSGSGLNAVAFGQSGDVATPSAYIP